jgi:hypothetical protein
MICADLVNMNHLKICRCDHAVNGTSLPDEQSNCGWPFLVQMSLEPLAGFPGRGDMQASRGGHPCQQETHCCLGDKYFLSKVTSDCCFKKYCLTSAGHCECG